MRAIPQIAVDFVASHEGCKTSAYLDSVGIATIGFGHIDGVKMGDRCTKAQALAWLATDMQIAVRKLYSVLKPEVIDGLTEHQWAALLSFAFNLGAKADWTIWKRINRGEMDQVPGELIKFCNAGGVKVQGLINRRADEVKLWSTDEPGTIAVAPPSSETRALGMTPPTPSDPVPAGKSSTIITGALGVAATVPVAAQQITAAVAPYADHSALVGKIIAVLATIAAVSAVVVLALNWIRKHEAMR